MFDSQIVNNAKDMLESMYAYGMSEVYTVSDEWIYQLAFMMIEDDIYGFIILHCEELITRFRVPPETITELQTDDIAISINSFFDQANSEMSYIGFSKERKTIVYTGTRKVQ